MKSFLEKINCFKTDTDIFAEYNSLNFDKISKREFNKLLKNAIHENIIDNSIIENGKRMYISKLFIESTGMAVDLYYLTINNTKTIDISKYFNYNDAIIESDINNNFNK